VVSIEPVVNIDLLSSGAMLSFSPYPQPRTLYNPQCSEHNKVSREPSVSNDPRSQLRDISHAFVFTGNPPGLCHSLLHVLVASRESTRSSPNL
jgi:hypothetical protein